MKKAVVLLIGPPGVGKGTLAKKCKQNMGLSALSTGEMLREQVELGTEIGLEVKDILAKGEFVSNELINKMFSSWFEQNWRNCQQGVLLDGYPRTAQQAEFLSSLLDEYKSDSRLFVGLLEASDEQILSRIAGRIMCSKASCGSIYSKAQISDSETQCPRCQSDLVKRDDDNAECAKGRLEKYLKLKDELIGYFEKNGVDIHKVETSDKNPDEVFQAFKQLFRAAFDCRQDDSCDGRPKAL